MKVYLSGPMKGYPKSNYPLFNAVAGQLRRAGHKVYNPAEFPHVEGEEFPLRKAFAEYTGFICEADAIVLLPGWEVSSGAGVEHALAKVLGLMIIEFKDLNFQ